VDVPEERSVAEAVADKLLADPDLARAVYKRLDAWTLRERRTQEKDKRRSGGEHASDFDTGPEMGART
jgi:hypothetical protein